MNDKQTTALVVLLIVSFTFWLYNSTDPTTGQNRLSTVVNTILGKQQSTSMTSSPDLQKAVFETTLGGLVNPGTNTNASTAMTPTFTTASIQPTPVYSSASTNNGSALSTVASDLATIGTLYAT